MCAALVHKPFTPSTKCQVLSKSRTSLSELVFPNPSFLYVTGSSATIPSIASDTSFAFAHKEPDLNAVLTLSSTFRTFPNGKWGHRSIQKRPSLWVALCFLVRLYASIIALPTMSLSF
ncbi:hypothetical protein BDR06DRAFT_949304 [Suillus hirtellus]|nr:hypothetical protein BDR06DRAFT_949304 [Suillus hirtellus]